MALHLDRTQKFAELIQPGLRRLFEDAADCAAHAHTEEEQALARLITKFGRKRTWSRVGSVRSPIWEIPHPFASASACDCGKMRVLGVSPGDYFSCVVEILSRFH